MFYNLDLLWPPLRTSESSQGSCQHLGHAEKPPEAQDLPNGSLPQDLLEPMPTAASTVSFYAKNQLIVMLLGYGSQPQQQEVGSRGCSESSLQWCLARQLPRMTVFSLDIDYLRSL